MATGDAKLFAMLRRVGVPVAVDFNGMHYTSRGVRDEGDGVAFEGDTGVFVGRVTSVLVATGELPDGALVEGAAIDVDGDAMRVVSALRADDGKLTRVTCAPE